LNKEIFVFAGPNGSGKSSVIKDFLSKGVCPQPYICPDEVFKEVKRCNPQLSLEDAYLRSFSQAEQERYDLVAMGKPFSFETVFSTNGKLQFLKTAKAQGYRIVVVYVTTTDFHINLRRVEKRVKTGGHDVPPEKTISRYQKSMSLMAEVIAFADEAHVLDNSTDNVSPQLILSKNSDGSVEFFAHSEWIKHYLEEPFQTMHIPFKTKY
jgi:Uncharacterized protein conserved in bacteria